MRLNLAVGPWARLRRRRSGAARDQLPDGPRDDPREGEEHQGPHESPTERSARRAEPGVAGADDRRGPVSDTADQHRDQAPLQRGRDLPRRRLRHPPRRRCAPRPTRRLAIAERRYLSEESMAAIDHVASAASTSCSTQPTPPPGPPAANAGGRPANGSPATNQRGRPSSMRTCGSGSTRESPTPAAQRSAYAQTSGHPKTTALREERILAALDPWLGQITDPAHRADTIAAVLSADTDRPAEPTHVRVARRAIRELPSNSTACSLPSGPAWTPSSPRRRPDRSNGISPLHKPLDHPHRTAPRGVDSR